MGGRVRQRLRREVEKTLIERVLELNDNNGKIVVLRFCNTRQGDGSNKKRREKSNSEKHGAMLRVTASLSRQVVGTEP